MHPRPGPLLLFIPLATVLALGVVRCTPRPPLFSKGVQPIHNATMNGIAPSAKSCAQCHSEIYKTWSNSRHAASFRNPNFRHSVEESHVKGWCLNCHQPLRRLTNELGEASDDGVSCAVCHIRNDTFLVSKPLSAKGREQHPASRVEATLNSSAFCAGCHQFSGPTATHPITYMGDPLQNTFNEWASSTDPQKHCQECHMPKGAHTFPGGHHIEMVNTALSVQHNAQSLTISTTTSVAHAVPTGDPFRRLELRICGVSCSTILQRRTFGIVHTYINGTMRITKDTRLQAPGQPGDRVSVPLPKGAKKWELYYFYADPRLHTKLPQDEVSVLLQSGTLESQFPIP